MRFPAVAKGIQALADFAYDASSVTFGDTPPAVVAPAVRESAGLTYDASPAGVCTVDSGTGALTLVAAGECVVTVTAAPTANYRPSTAQFTVTVRPRGTLALDLDPIAGDDVVNAAEKAAGFAITGDTGGEAGAAVTVAITGLTGHLAATSASDGTWSVQVPADAAYLTGTSITVTVNAAKAGLTDAAAVTRTLAVDLAAPALVSATVDGAVLTLTYGEDLDRDAVPAGSAFAVKVGGTAADLAGTDPVAVSARAVTLTLAAPVAHGDTVTVSYTKPASHPVRDEAGNEAANLDDETVTNDTAEMVPPRVTSIERHMPSSSPTSADTLVWRVTFSEDVQNVTRDDFALAGTSATLTVAAVQGSRSAYDVTAAGGDLAGLDGAVTLSFATGQDIVDLADNALADTAPTGTDERTWVVDNTAPTVSYTAPGRSRWGWRSRTCARTRATPTSRGTRRAASRPALPSTRATARSPARRPPRAPPPPTPR